MILLRTCRSAKSIVEACPSFKASKLSESPPNALFCARGKSSIPSKVKTISCYCPACEVFTKYSSLSVTSALSDEVIFFSLFFGYGISTLHHGKPALWSTHFPVGDYFFMRVPVSKISLIREKPALSFSENYKVSPV